MKKNICLVCLILSSFFLLFNPKEIFADTVSPFKNVVDIQISKSSTEEISFTNESDNDKEILLKVYGYDPEKEEISEDISTLLRVNTDTFDVSGGETKKIQYEVVVPEGTEKGTYFNLLVLETVSDLDESNVVTTPSLSQIVEINVYASGNDSYSLPENPGSIEIEVVDRGIPFIKGATIKYTYTNTSNYVLQPEGELQIFNEQQNEEPMYIQINDEEEYLYPGEELTETFTTDTYSWSLDDLIYDRTILGRFYNGVDGAYQGEKATIGSFRDESLVTVVAFLFLVILLSESSKGRGRKISKKNEDEIEDDTEE